MERNIIEYEEELSFSRIMVQVNQTGDDYHIVLKGGEKPHIGCCVLAIPRPSLKEDGSTSVTSSVINVTGHKDEQVCRYLAEQTAIKKKAVVVCSGGFHMDDITEAQIKEVIETVEKIEKKV